MPKNTSLYIASVCLGLSTILLLQACSSNKSLYPVKIDSSYGFINREGDLLVPPKYPNVQRYSEGFAPVQCRDGSLVYLDLDGKELEAPDDYGPIEKLDLFSDGMARVVVAQKVGYVDRQLRWVIPPQYAQAGRFSEGLAAVLYSAENRVIYIDKKGAEVFTLDNVSAAGPMRAGFAYFVRSGRFGIINKQGEITTPPSYLFLATADPVSGLARALDDKTELYGFVDSNGSWIIAPLYPNAGDFSYGFAAVFMRNKNRYGYIDTRGNVCISGQYLTGGNFHEGFAWVRTDKGFRYIDRDGRWLSPLIFRYTHDFYGGLAAASQGDKFLYINTQGTVTWPNHWTGEEPVRTSNEPVTNQ